MLIALAAVSAVAVDEVAMALYVVAGIIAGVSIVVAGVGVIVAGGMSAVTWRVPRSSHM